MTLPNKSLVACIDTYTCMWLQLTYKNFSIIICRLDENMVTKVSDFGLTRDVYTNDYYKLDHSAMLPVKWLAPEALLDRIFTVKTDVVSALISCIFNLINSYINYTIMMARKNCFLIHFYLTF